MQAREIEEGKPAKLSQRALSNNKVLDRLANRAKLTTEELKNGPIKVLAKDADGHAEFRHENHAGTFTCHGKFFELAAN